MQLVVAGAFSCIDLENSCGMDSDAALAGQSDLTWHSPHPMPVYRHLLTTTGEREMSGGESQGQVDGVGPASLVTGPSLDVETGLPRASKMGSLHFWWPRRVAVVEPPVLYLQSTVPTAACDLAVVFRPTGYSSLACRVLPLRSGSLSYDPSSAWPPPWQERCSPETS